MRVLHSMIKILELIGRLIYQKRLFQRKIKKLPTFKEFEKNNDFVHGEVEL